MSKKIIFRAFSVLIFFLLFSCGISLAREQETGYVGDLVTERLEEEKGLEEEKKGPPIELTFTNTITYSDNIYHYSNDRREQYDRGEKKNRFQGVSSIGDFSERIKGDIAKEFTFIDGYPTKINLFAEGTFYFKNHERDYQRYGGSIKQRVGSYKTLRLGYYYIPPHFSRCSYDRDVNDYRKKRYDRHSVFLRYWMRFIPALSGWVQYRARFTDYSDDFKEQDSVAHTVSTGVKYYLIPDRAYLNLSSGYTWTSAAGEDDDPQIDSDRSRNSLFLSGGGGVKLIEKLWAILGYRATWTKYTTSNSVVDDPYRKNRHDLGQSAFAELRYYITDDVRWTIVGYRYSCSDPEFSSEAVSSDLVDEGIVGYQENAIYTALRISF